MSEQISFFNIAFEVVLRLLSYDFFWTINNPSITIG